MAKPTVVAGSQVTGIHGFGALFNSTAVAASDTAAVLGFADLSTDKTTATLALQALAVSDTPALTGAATVTLGSSAAGLKEAELGQSCLAGALALLGWRYYYAQLQADGVTTDYGYFAGVQAVGLAAGAPSPGPVAALRSLTNTTGVALAVPDVGTFADGTPVMVTADGTDTHVDLLAVDAAGTVTVTGTLTVPGDRAGTPLPLGDALFLLGGSHYYLLTKDGSLSSYSLPAGVSGPSASALGTKVLLTDSAAGHRVAIAYDGSSSAVATFTGGSLPSLLPFRGNAWIEPDNGSVGQPRTRWRGVDDQARDVVNSPYALTDDLVQTYTDGWSHQMLMAVVVGNYVVVLTEGDYTNNWLYLINMVPASLFPPSLRMTQRNDGRGVAGHPRLRAGTSPPSSLQVSAAPRLGDHDRYH